MFRLRPKYNCVYDSLLFTALRVISPWLQVVGAKAEQLLRHYAKQVFKHGG